MHIPALNPLIDVHGAILVVPQKTSGANIEPPRPDLIALVLESMQSIHDAPCWDQVIESPLPQPKVFCWGIFLGKLEL